MASCSKEGKESDESKGTCIYQAWMTLQEQELSQLNEAIALHETGLSGEAELVELIGKIMKHFQDYVARRSVIARADTCSYFALTWCNSLEKSALWIGGCRPSAYFRLIYTICGLKIESQLADFLAGHISRDLLGDLTGEQVQKLDELQRQAIKEETELSSSLAALQQGYMDMPLAAIPLEGGGNADDVLAAHSKEMAAILETADQLRIDTLTDLVRTLLPQQAANFLAAGKKLQLCMNEWGRKIDLDHGRN